MTYWQKCKKWAAAKAGRRREYHRAPKGGYRVVLHYVPEKAGDRWIEYWAWAEKREKAAKKALELVDPTQ